MLGFENYNYFTLKNNRVAKTPIKVVEFLNTLSKIVEPIAKEEMKILEEEKNKWEGSSTIYPWDKPYYAGIAKAKKYNLTSTQLKEYFTLGNCMEGIRIICNRLFDIDLHFVPMNNYETWHPDVYKIHVVHKDNGLIGILYLDVFSRQNKFSHAATFTLQLPKVDESGQLLSVPKVALVCNFNDESEGIPTLSYSELETLFHEFGHCMSALMSRTQLQHVAGTRAALDFIETPSTLMEYFATDKRILSLFAKSYKTGEVIPSQLLLNLTSSQSMFAAIDIQQQISYAMFDQIIHSKYPLENSISSIYFDLQSKYTNVIPTSNDYWYSRFGHLIGYGSGYYSYLYSKTFSGTIWQKCFVNDPLDKFHASRYAEKILYYGGSKDPLLMLNDLLGSEPSPLEFIKSIKNI